MTDSYITVSSPSCEEIIINKSRFIGMAKPCSEESEALLFLQSVREEHKTATHHCYAYIIGDNSGIMRYSDDGEPGGTAGLPIMDTMRTKRIVNCCIVVVRYFGGVLLGTGGLVRAYTQAAQAALKASGIARMELTSVEHCEVPYSVWDKIRYSSEHLPVQIVHTNYSSAVSFDLLCRTRDKDSVISALMEASDRKLMSEPLNEMFSPWNIE